MRNKLLVTMSVVVAALAASSVATAAKGSSSLTLVVVGATANAATVQPSYGSTITFDVTTNETAQPNVNVRCYQGKAFVYDAWGAFWPGALVGQDFTLSSNYWTGGPATCTARLVAFDKQGRQKTLASTAFDVTA